MIEDIDYNEWETIIQKGITPFELELTKEQIQLFHIHAQELVQWTRKVNITAITDAREIAIKHFVDSILPLSFLPQMRKVLDVGSGGGFPSLPLKVIYPDIQLTLVDAVRKKVSFMQHVIRKLQLKRAKAVHTRVENIRHQGDAFILYDTIVCRALSYLTFIIPNVLPLLSTDGEIVVWKGRMPESEIKEFQARFPDQALHLNIKVKSYRLPIYDAERHIVKISSLRNANESLKDVKVKNK